MPPLTAEGFAAQCHVSRETLARLEIYERLLRKWQPAINLVSRDSLADVWRRHFLDSAQLADRIPTAQAQTIVDIGSGAGFPGLVLAILAGAPAWPWTVHLVESDSRKCAFLATVARESGATATVHNRRIEQLAAVKPHVAADLVVARALAPLDKLLSYAVPLLKPDGACLFLKGEAAEDELTAARKTWNMTIDRWPSRSGPTGVILRIGAISLVRSNT